MRSLLSLLLAAALGADSIPPSRDDRRPPDPDPDPSPEPRRAGAVRACPDCGRVGVGRYCTGHGHHRRLVQMQATEAAALRSGGGGA